MKISELRPGDLFCFEEGSPAVYERAHEEGDVYHYKPFSPEALGYTRKSDGNFELGPNLSFVSKSTSEDINIVLVLRAD